MSRTWFCYNCNENIGEAEKCPYWGYSRNGEEDKYTPTAKHYAFARKALNLNKDNVKKTRSGLTDEECLALGLYPNDEGYKKVWFQKY